MAQFEQTSGRSGLAAIRRHPARFALAALVIFLAAAIPYLPFLSLPFISDSYLQVFLGRNYGPISRWNDLAGDVLYRSRATSLIVTFLTDLWNGPDPTTHRLVSLLFHIANSFLIAALGLWHRIGWRISIPAAIFFAFCEVHQEAVIWAAALPELLVFFFAILALLCWLRGLQFRSPLWLWASFFAYLLALISKESAVIIPVALAGIWQWELRQWRPPLVVLASMAAVAVVYAIGIFTASSHHLHLNDGTFSFHAPFLLVLANSAVRLLLPWGWIALLLLCLLLRRRALILLSLLWILLAFLPYSFLTYMSRVPSRHTYLASLGLALLMGAAFHALRLSKRPWAPQIALALALAVLSQSLFYLWTKKFDQYQRRAEPTERFLDFAAQSAEAPVNIVCGAYGFEAFRYAAIIRLNTLPGFVVDPDDSSATLSARPYCDTSKP